MSHSYKFSLTNGETGDEINLSGEFSDDDWQFLNDFLEYTRDLLATKFVQDGMSSSLKIKWDADTGMQVSSQ